MNNYRKNEDVKIGNLGKMGKAGHRNIRVSGNQGMGRKGVMALLY
jgi:hypothetical protein